MFYAHTTKNPDKSDWQPLKTHLTNVAKISQQFANDFNAGELAYASGLLHDLGKYSPEFQRRLEGANIHVDHSTAGAKEATRIFKGAFEPAGIFSAYQISGHHGGLLNFGSQSDGLCARLQRKNLPDYSAYINEIRPEVHQDFHFKRNSKRKTIGFCYSFFTRMLYSCLVDADSLDTEAFVSQEKSFARGQYDSFETLQKNFENYMQEKSTITKDSPLNRERKKIYSQCIEAGSLQPGFFTLTVPTGGGKTLSSMGFALEHLKNYNRKRIFYIIPYTSIIEQNAKVFRDVFGSRNVLEHHSNFDPKTVKNENGDPVGESLALAAENWDMPIVVTTNVQFFESLFSNKRSRCRKLHNLAESIIILDEAQMLPTGYLLPCLAALSELVRNYGATVVICTATQPKIRELLDKDLHIEEIMKSPSPEDLHKSLNRVCVKTIDSSLNDIELCDRLKKHRQILCIVNTRTHAKKLYEALKESGKCYHLSARMCPVHRRAKLEKIKSLLKEGEDCRVISTQLIEAGVDIDFPIVYRIMSGIDSIAQAAGRCNREGKLPTGDVFIFKSLEKYGRATPWQNRVAEIGEMALNASEDPLSLQAVADYFGRLYHYEDLDVKKILPTVEERSGELAFPFEDIARDFQLIEGGTRDLIIPFGKDAKSMIDELRRSDSPWWTARALQGYTVSIYPNEFREMERMNAIEIIDDRFYILNTCEDYSDETGLENRSKTGYDGSLLIK